MVSGILATKAAISTQVDVRLNVDLLNSPGIPFDFSKPIIRKPAPQSSLQIGFFHSGYFMTKDSKESFVSPFQCGSKNYNVTAQYDGYCGDRRFTTVR